MEAEKRAENVNTRKRSFYCYTKSRDNSISSPIILNAIEEPISPGAQKINVPKHVDECMHPD